MPLARGPAVWDIALKKARYPLRVGDQVYLMINIIKLVRTRVHERLGAQGVVYTFPQTAVLVKLRETAGMSAAELARVAMVRPQTINKLLAKLYGDGLIEARDDPAHGRIRRIFLTKTGKEITKKFDAASNEITGLMFSNVSSAEQTQLESILQRCAESLQQNGAADE
jgi:MarR family transcriptional regulator for hemolysin